MIFGFLPQNVKTKAVAVAFSIAWLEAGVEPRPDDAQARGWLAGFRRELYRCFTARADALFELADAVLCAGGPAVGMMAAVPDVDQAAALTWYLVPRPAMLASWVVPAGRGNGTPND